MSLVLEALRRVERPGTGSVGATVASYRPARRKGALALPLFLGLLAGGLWMARWGSRETKPAEVPLPAVEPPSRIAPGRAGLPPPMFEPISETRAIKPGVAVAPSRPGSAPPPPRASLVLQAISERDSHPIAIINEQLVREGDLVGDARVLKIGPDSVEVLLRNGVSETVRFPPPPPPEPSPSPGSPLTVNP